MRGQKLADCVPEQYKYFAITIRQRPDYWADEEQIRADLQLEAVGNDKIETFLAMVRAQRALVDKFLSGELSKNDDAGMKAAMVDVGLIEGEEDPMFAGVELNEEQKRHPQADVDTCSGAFFLYKDAMEVMDCLTQYDMIAVDEVSQLTQADFERIIQMWEAADKVELYQMRRCKDKVLKKKLEALRTARPTREQLNKICRGHKTWSGRKEPTAWDLTELYRNHPNTTIATCTRRAAAKVNNLSIWVLFTTRRKRKLATLPVDWESNPENYDPDRADEKLLSRLMYEVSALKHVASVDNMFGIMESWYSSSRQDNYNELITGKPPQALDMPLYKGMRLYLTRNVNKEADFVNGMSCTVENYDSASKCLHVATKTSRQLAVYPMTDYVPDCGYVTAYPVRPGYAGTIHKLQGAELEHITVWLDIKNAKAAGYVALSRVQTDNDYISAGRRGHCKAFSTGYVTKYFEDMYAAKERLRPYRQALLYSSSCKQEIPDGQTQQRKKASSERHGQ
eukprot:Skav230239  [mRNA]  locus=scaffold1818:72176:74263:+ [translate_table: standard]